MEAGCAELSFRRLTDADLPLLHDWLQRGHVRRWWRDTTTYEETVAHYGPALRGEDPTDHYVIVVDGRDAGMIETYLVSDHPEWESVVEVGEGVAGVDLLIGDVGLVGRGLGPRILRAFVDGVVFTRAGVHACVAAVDEENRPSWRAFEKAGFRHVRDVEENGRPHRLLRLDR
ncbi:MAG TPA: GNAT family N-acetyltransferase [Gaiellaceae bacterium]|nr:GNAT family N-acetyltransferase [Gaiellaceae bacterium]